MARALAPKTATLAALLCLTTAPLRVHAESAKPAATRSAATKADSEPPEPPPAPLETQEVEPRPAELIPEAPPSPSPKPPAAPKAKPARPWVPYRAAGWTGFGLTLAMVTTGTVLGVLAQNRSDELGRITGIVEDGQPPIYDAARRLEFETLQNDGRSFNRGTIALFSLAGVTALATGLLFWEASKLAPRDERVAISGSLWPSGGGLTVSGSF